MHITYQMAMSETTHLEDRETEANTVAALHVYAHYLVWHRPVHGPGRPRAGPGRAGPGRAKKLR